MVDFPAAEPVVLHDRLDVATLLRYLRRDGRTRPVVVLTVAPGQTGPYVSAADLAREVGRGTDIVTIPLDDLTRAMSDWLEDSRAGVYRGACRVYPPGVAWETDPLGTPLRMARDPAEVAALWRHLVGDVGRARTARNHRPGSSAPSVAAPVSSPRAAPALPGPPGGSGRATPVPGPALPSAVATPTQAEALAEFLRRPARRRPVVVVSRSATAGQPYADVAKLTEDLEGLACVVEIATVEASWAFSRAVPEGCQVYGGAGRTYPVGTAWEDDPYASPLRFAYGWADRSRITHELAGDVMRMASSGSLSLGPSAGTPAEVEGTVLGVVADRALVDLGGPGERGVVWPELVEPDVPAERLFSTGMTIRGVLDPESRRIDVRGMRRAAGDALAGVAPGDTILVRVETVASGSCVVEPFPGRRHTVTADNVVDDGSDLRSVLSEGEVVPALLVEVERAGAPGRPDEWLLSVAEAADPADAVPAPSILEGGPPWLTPVEATDQPATSGEESPDGQDGSGPPEAAPTVELVAALRQEKAQLVAQFERERHESDRLRGGLRAARAELRKAKRRRDRSGGPAIDDAVLFEDAAEQLDFLIRLAWARMVPPAEKHALPLRTWTYGPDFLASLDQIEGVSRDKVVEVIVHVLTGRDTELVSRELHQLRTGPGGDDRPVTRERGEICWRVSLQSNTPAARRLHYWQCADGSVELSSVRLHDDFRP